MSKKNKSSSSSATMKGAPADEGEIKIVTYRDHHHTFPLDTPGITVVNRAKTMTGPRRFLQFAFSIFMVHYFLWIFGMIGVLYLFYKIGLWYISALLVAIYIPTFINNDQFKSGRPWPEFRRSSLWRLTSRYLGIEVVRTAKLPPGQLYTFGVYPHGILILSRIAMYGGVWEHLFPDIETRVLGASPMFLVPGSREICLWMGAVDAAKKVAMACMNKFRLNLMVYPGGSDEIFLTDPNSPATTLLARKGWIKLSIQSGASLVPAFVFGEKWLYHRKPVSESVKRWFMKNLRLPLIVFWGRFFSWLPYNKKQDGSPAFLSVVFGKPIPVVKQDEPSDEYIEQLFLEYIEQVKTIFETYKGKFGYPDNEYLVIKDAKDRGVPATPNSPTTPATVAEEKNGSTGSKGKKSSSKKKQ